MLKRLYISNFALIQEMDVDFPGGLTVITGETGAGKSIFLEALGLALGKRAETAALSNKTKKCVVEAEFETKGLDLRSFFEEQELEYDPHLVLRREIGADGKSRSFLNDALVSLSVLKLLSERLIDIHSQHQTLLLNQANFQLELLDAFAGSQELYQQYKSDFTRLSKLRNELSQLQSREQQARKEADYLQFMFNELSENEIVPGQLSQLEEESLSLENAETIKSTLIKAASALNGGDDNLLTTLAGVKQALQSISKYSKNNAAFLERVNSAYLELKDLADEMDTEGEHLNFDNARLEEVNVKLDKLNRLLKKHGVKEESELLAVRNEIEEKLSAFGSLESDIEKCSKEIKALEKACVKTATQLTEKRKAAIPAIEKQVKDMLGSLSMDNAVFKIEMNQISELSLSGSDQVRFLFSANKGAVLNELQKVASGGELSRLMLSLKALLAGKKQLPTIIFDEIDTGVSGDVADKIGNILHEMGSGMQVITITHLPQMASKGQHHLFVYKNDHGDQTVSHIRALDAEERVTEIAKMLSTSKPTESALKNARELLNV